MIGVNIMIVKHRRGTTKEWQKVDLIPEEGEIVIEECNDGSLKCKIGNGDAKFSQLPYIDDKTRLTLLQEITNTRTGLEDKLAALEVEAAKAVTNIKKQLDADIAAEESARKETDSLLQQSITSVENAVVDRIQLATDHLTAQLTSYADNIASRAAVDIATLNTDLNNSTQALNKKISENISEWYIDQNFNRYHRFKFARKTIPDNIIKFFDSGNTKYIWHRSEV